MQAPRQLFFLMIFDRCCPEATFASRQTGRSGSISNFGSQSERGILAMGQLFSLVDRACYLVYLLWVLSKCMGWRASKDEFWRVWTCTKAWKRPMLKSVFQAALQIKMFVDFLTGRGMSG